MPLPHPKLEFSHRRMREPKEEKEEKREREKERERERKREKEKERERITKFKNKYRRTLQHPWQWHCHMIDFIITRQRKEEMCALQGL